MPTVQLTNRSTLLDLLIKSTSTSFELNDNDSFSGSDNATWSVADWIHCSATRACTPCRELREVQQWLLAILAALGNNLETTEINIAKIVHASISDLTKFLWTFYWMKHYPSEKSLAARSGWSDKTVRRVVKEMTLKINALKPQKIVWPLSWDDPNVDTPIFIISVDGTHCPLQEPTKGHPYSKNPKYYSHKFHQSALAYKVAISCFTSQVVWINGPFPAGTRDPDIFKLPGGLKSRLKHGQKVVADSAYKQKELPMISATNHADTCEVRLFKRRVRARQESFFSKMKVFNILKQEFCQGEAFHQVVFTAIAVICQYEIDFVPLFDA